MEISDIRLSKNFMLSEFLKSDTAKKKKIINSPNQWQHLLNIKELSDLLQTIRDAYGKPIIITSGFRSEALNKAVGGSKTSAHMKGLAADIKASDGNNRALWDLIVRMGKEGKIEWDQLIDEKKLSWIHIGLNDNKKRNQILYM